MLIFGKSSNAVKVGGEPETGLAGNHENSRDHMSINALCEGAMVEIVTRQERVDGRIILSETFFPNMEKLSE